ncbi:putative monooxygenase fad-binding protein [Neofusicoccum parvum UCRNP2]|uniref:Putative monooxygenase fad-binding protein n=1 Tax=Botryosphaeria parva (strain UCR-NP2) TaxID=1287680 RepID=R1GKZ6_BOTPV|nr:putative monooxygenase fad-binding protein [Neofusicoccum parvum UCRNP2]
MASKSSHQVIIVGGGITGLTLALMLQNLNIDFVLLEGYSSVTPNVGASIGLYANGVRVLDQLGLYQDILKVAQSAKRHVVRDGDTGKVLTRLPCGPELEARHGYSALFMQRHQLLCILYEHLVEKERVLVNKKVHRIEHLADSVLVHTTDGGVFEGQMVVGADGVHSTVRKEMRRTAEELEPGYIPKKDKENIKCEYACVFGFAKPTKTIAPGDVVAASKNYATAGVMGAQTGEVFLFWFWKLPSSQSSCKVEDIPRLTKEDQARELQRGGDVIVADPEVRLKDVVNNLERSAVTALPHFVFSKWHFRRVITVGDAAHKFNPLVGQGGNSCIESCAALVNELTATLSASDLASPSWPLESLEKVFTAVETQRVPRLLEMVEKSQQAQRASAWDSWALKLASKHVVPLQSLHQFTDFYSSFITGGVSLKTLAMPDAIHEWPYDDEKKDIKGQGSNLPAILTTASFAVFAGILLERKLRNGTILGN